MEDKTKETQQKITIEQIQQMKEDAKLESITKEEFYSFEPVLWTFKEDWHEDVEYYATHKRELLALIMYSNEDKWYDNVLFMKKSDRKFRPIDLDFYHDDIETAKKSIKHRFEVIQYELDMAGIQIGNMDDNKA